MDDSFEQDAGYLPELSAHDVGKGTFPGFNHHLTTGTDGLLRSPDLFRRLPTRIATSGRRRLPGNWLRIVAGRLPPRPHAVAKIPSYPCHVSRPEPRLAGRPAQNPDLEDPRVGEAHRSKAKRDRGLSARDRILRRSRAPRRQLAPLPATWQQSSPSRSPACSGSPLRRGWTPLFKKGLQPCAAPDLGNGSLEHRSKSLEVRSLLVCQLEQDRVALDNLQQLLHQPSPVTGIPRIRRLPDEQATEVWQLPRQQKGLIEIQRVKSDQFKWMSRPSKSTERRGRTREVEIVLLMPRCSCRVAKSWPQRCSRHWATPSAPDRAAAIRCCRAPPSPPFAPGRLSGGARKRRTAGHLPGPGASKVHRRWIPCARQIC